MTDGDTARPEIPPTWDVLRAGEPEPPDPDHGPEEGEPDTTPPTLSVLAASWADAVLCVAVCTAALMSLSTTARHETVTALPWAAALAAVWWATATAVLVVVRHGTPGMLLAGVVFDRRVATGRVVPVLLAAALSAALLGLPGLLGARYSPIALAAARRLESIPTA